MSIDDPDLAHITGGAQIRARRSALGLTQSDLARRAFGSVRRKSDVSRIESGKVRNPQAATIRAIAKALSMDDAALMTLFARPPAPPDKSARELAREIAARSVPVSTVMALARRADKRARDLNAALQVLEEAAIELARARAAPPDKLALDQLQAAIDGAGDLDTNRLTALTATHLHRQGQGHIVAGDTAQAIAAIRSSLRLTHLDPVAEAGALMIEAETALARGERGDAPQLFELSAALAEQAALVDPTDDRSVRATLIVARARRHLGDRMGAPDQLDLALQQIGRLLERPELPSARRRDALTERSTLRRLTGARHGDGDAPNAALSDAEDAARLDRSPPAPTLLALSAALRSLGERRGDADMLRRAVTTAETALGRLGARVPAVERVNALIALGSAQHALGEQTGDPALFRNAQAQFESAYGAADHDGFRAICQHNLGLTAQSVGARNRTVAPLKAAIAAFDDALRLRGKSDAPMHWAATHSAQGDTLQILAQIGGDATLLDRAVTAYETALGVQTASATPLAWATTQNNLATALQALGKRRRDRSLLNRAVRACEAALTVRSRATAPVDWAVTTTNLAITCAAQYDLTRDARQRSEALRHLEAATEVFRETKRSSYLEQARRLAARLDSQG